MKKITAFLLCAIMLCSALFLVSCGGNNDPAPEETLKLGLGVYSTASATNADGDANGKGSVTITAATVLVDKDGKIVKCVVDTADLTAVYTSEGKAVAATDLRTKYELGADYGMKPKTWADHADAFCKAAEGKTVSEVKAFVAEDGKNTDAIITAGCTIGASDFVKAVEKAVANAKDSTATKSSTLKLGVITTQATKDANEDVAGSNAFTTDIFAVAVDAEGKYVAATNEEVVVSFAFDETGKTTFKAGEVKGKRELGADYGMKPKTWADHADEFCKAIVGKKASDITADFTAAGCTIGVDAFVAVLAKIG